MRGRKTIIWTPVRKQFIRENAGKMTDDAIASRLTKEAGFVISINAVRQQRRALGIRKQSGRGKCMIIQ